MKKTSVTPYALSVFFTLFVMAQFWNLFNARCFGMAQSAFKGIVQNKGFLLISLVIFIGQILIVQFGGRVFRTVPLSLRDWLYICAGSSVVLWVGEILRFIKKQKVSPRPSENTSP